MIMNTYLKLHILGMPGQSLESGIQDSGLWIPDPGLWIQDFLDAGSWIQDTGSRTLGPGHYIQYLGSRIKDAGYGRCSDFGGPIVSD